MMPGVETHWPAPAKLNLFLHVTGRRADGYHELQTLFQLIDLADTVTIAVREDGLIERPVGPAGVDPEDRPQRARRPGSAAGDRHPPGGDARPQKAHPHGGWPGRGQLRCGHRSPGSERALGVPPAARRAGGRRNAGQAGPFPGGPRPSTPDAGPDGGAIGMTRRRADTRASTSLPRLPANRKQPPAIPHNPALIVNIASVP